MNTELRDFLDANPVGVLATLTPGGKPRQSLVYYVRDGDRLLISTVTDRLKASDVRRSGWASLCVMGHTLPYPSATFAGRAEVLTEGIAAPTMRIGQRMSGAEEPPEAITDESLAAVGRVLIAITVDRVTAASYVATEAQRPS